MDLWLGAATPVSGIVFLFIAIASPVATSPDTEWCLVEPEGYAEIEIWIEFIPVELLGSQIRHDRISGTEIAYESRLLMHHDTAGKGHILKYCHPQSSEDRHILQVITQTEGAAKIEARRLGVCPARQPVEHYGGDEVE